jgi:hypothetical protein
MNGRRSSAERRRLANIDSSESEATIASDRSLPVEHSWPAEGKDQDCASG